MAGVAQLKAMVGLDPRGFQAGARKVKGETTSLQKSLASVGKAAAAIFSVAMIQRAARAILQWATDVSIAARNVGILTEEMIALNRMAIQYSLNASDMQRMMARLQTEIHRAATEGGKSAESFGKIGVNVKDLIGLDPVSQLRAIASAATSSGLPLENLASIFGERLGPRAVAMLKDLAENGLGAVSAEAGRLADQAEMLGSLWARRMDEMKQKTLEWTNALGVAYEKHAAYYRVLAGGFGHKAAWASVVALETKREKQLEQLAKGRADQQRQQQEELAHLYQQRMIDAQNAITGKAQEDIEKLATTIKASRFSASGIEAQGAAFAGAGAGGMISAVEKQIQIARETQAIQRRMESELQALNSQISDQRRRSE